MNVELAWEEFIDENRVFLGIGWDGVGIGKRSKILIFPSLRRIVLQRRTIRFGGIIYTICRILF
jgi:hypothetical protein